MIHPEPILWAELPPVAQPCRKWSTEARRLEDLPRLVRRACKTASLAHPTGPVFLSLPVDVLNAEARPRLPGADAHRPPDRGAARGRPRRGAAPGASAAAADSWAGDCVAHGDAPRRDSRKLRRLLGAPVMSRARGEHLQLPRSRTRSTRGRCRGSPADPRRARGATTCSCARSAATSSRSALPSDVDPMAARASNVVHLDVDSHPGEPRKNYPAAVAILGDPKADAPRRGPRRCALELGAAGHPEAAGGGARPRAGPRRAARGAVRARAQTEAGRVPISALAACRALAETVADDAVVGRRVDFLLGGACRDVRSAAGTQSRSSPSGAGDAVAGARGAAGADLGA